MLVLTRKQGEQIKIDGRIEVTVLSVQGHRVRIGIQAPSDVSVRRGELVVEMELDQSSIETRELATF